MLTWLAYFPGYNLHNLFLAQAWTVATGDSLAPAAQHVIGSAVAALLTSLRHDCRVRGSYACGHLPTP